MVSFRNTSLSRTVKKFVKNKDQLLILIVKEDKKVTVLYLLTKKSTLKQA